MRVLLFLTLLTVLLTISPVFSKKCTARENEDQLNLCQSQFDEVVNKLHQIYIQPSFIKTSVEFQNFTIACDSWTSCIGADKCEDKQFETDRYAMLCEHTELMLTGVPDCWRDVFQAIYKGKFECSQEYAFMAKNLTRKSESLINGQTCFLNIIHRTCEQDAFNYINTNYQEIVKILTVNEETDTCRNIHHLITQTQCLPIIDDLYILNNQSPKLSDNDREKANRLCRQGLNCMTKQCPSITSNAYYNFKNLCLYLQYKHNEFWKCAFDTYSSDWSSFPCQQKINSMQFMKKVDWCERSKMQKECAREVIGKKCNGTDQEYEDFFTVRFSQYPYCD